MECCETLYSNSSLILILTSEEGAEQPSHIGMTWLLEVLQDLHQVSIISLREFGHLHLQTQAISGPLSFLLMPHCIAGKMTITQHDH